MKTSPWIRERRGARTGAGSGEEGLQRLIEAREAGAPRIAEVRARREGPVVTADRARAFDRLRRLFLPARGGAEA
jgi:hypothetical protein